jgi:hypothetical protein
VPNISCLITPWRMKIYPIMILMGIFLAVLFCVFSVHDGAIVTGRLGGDFPAFYAAGKLVAQGEIQSIYDSERMLAEQQHVIPTGGYLPFVNPPHFACFYAPLGALPYNFAYLVYFCFQVLLLSYVVYVFAALKYFDTSLFFFVLFVCITFYPLFKCVLGGQNSVISLFLLCLVWKFSTSGHEGLAGICLGLLLYKPQFAIPFIGLFFLAGYWRVVVSAILVGSSIVCGTVFLLKHSFQDWLTFAFAFSERDASVNKLNSISLSGVFDALSGGVKSPSLGLAELSAVLIVISISMLWYKGKRKRNLNVLMAAACPAVLLIPPHVMYYDLGICTLSVLLLLKDKVIGLIVVLIIWLLGCSQIFSHVLGFSPLFLVTLMIYGYFYHLAWSQGIEKLDTKLRADKML